MASDVCALGIDVGSTTVKIVGVDAEGNLAWHFLEQADPRVEDQIERFLALTRPSLPPARGGDERGGYSSRRHRVRT